MRGLAGGAFSIGHVLTGSCSEYAYSKQWQKHNMCHLGHLSYTFLREDLKDKPLQLLFMSTLKALELEDLNTLQGNSESQSKNHEVAKFCTYLFG